MNSGFKGVRNLNGRPKGAINKNSAETKELLRQIITNQLEDVELLLNELPPRDRVDAIIKLLPYIMPKQNEIVLEDKNVFTPLTVNLITAVDGNSD